jgi:broad specificity phosphatase PhoE
MSIKVAFFRHAPSTFNINGDLSPNVPTTDDGKLLAKSMKGHVDLVICSTLRRARETLDHSEIVYKRVIYTDLCRELLDGNTSNLYNGESNTIETPQDIEYRISRFKEFILQQPEATTGNDQPRIAVISHGCFLHKMLGYGFGNCQCHILTI